VRVTECQSCGATIEKSGPGTNPKHCPPCHVEHRKALGRKAAERAKVYGPHGAVCICKYCGETFVAATSTATVCTSIHCKRARGRAGQVVRLQKTKAAALPCATSDCPRPAFTRGLCRRHYKQATTGSELVEQFTCIQCGTDCVPGIDGVSPFASRFCSEACKRQHHGPLHRVRRAFVADVSKAAILERDKWTCQLCGERIPRTARWPHPLSASMDHVIPLSLGGTHEPANVQSAHLGCNSTKGNRGGGEQLALLG
jgi:hypothetical protein